MSLRSVQLAAPSTIGIGNAQRLPRWRTALAKVLAGSAQARVAFIGDSTTTGVSTSTLQTQCPAQRVATLLSARGYPVRADSFQGQQSTSLNSAALMHAYDPRLTLGANIGWNQTVFGVAAFNVPAGTGIAADTLSFTPTGAFDTLEIYTLAHTGWGSVAVNVDGGATVVTINENQASNIFQKTVQTVTRVTGGTHVINLVCTGNCFIVGVLAYDSTIPSVNCLNFGWSGGTLAQLIASTGFPWNPGSVASASQGLGVYSPDLTVIYLGINDQASTPLATYQSNLQTLISYAQFSGDCIVMNMWGNASASDATTRSFNAAIAAAAVAQGVPYIDQYAQYGTSANGQAIGLLIGDGTHPTPAGYSDRANILGDLLVNLS